MLYIGDILSPHGLKGAFIVFSHTRPANAVAGYLRWHVGHDENHTKVYDVINCHQHGKKMRALLDGIERIEQAESLKGMKIWIPEDHVACDDDEYLWDALIGCKVLNQDGDVLGKITALHEFGAQDIIEIQTFADAQSPGEWLLPFIDDVIVLVDLDKEMIEVNLLDGMDACFTPKS